MAFYNGTDFDNWLKGKGIARQYKSNIDTLRDKILAPLGCEVLVNDIGKIIVDSKYQSRIIPTLEKLNRFLSEMTILANRNNQKAVFVLNGNTVAYLQDRNSALKNYIDYLKGILPTIKTKANQYKVTPWNNAINSFEGKWCEVCSTNGIDSLLSHYSKPQDFIRDIISNSYFFTKKAVRKQSDIIVQKYYKNSVMNARKSTDTSIQNNNFFYGKDDVANKSIQIPINIDPTGNRNVVDLIENVTGYTVSTGQISLFSNFNISHIWQNAFDPRYFTNLWNLVIVPAWGNFLLDKTSATDDLTLYTINTFKAICIKLYGIKELKLDQIGINYNNIKPNKKYVLSGNYTVNVVNNLANNQLLATIIKDKPIHI